MHFTRGVTPLGEDSEGSTEDGHKFGCGIPLISSVPIIYSFGSNKQQGHINILIIPTAYINVFAKKE